MEINYITFHIRFDVRLITMVIKQHGEVAEWRGFGPSGAELCWELMDYIKKEFNLQIGRIFAERIIFELGCPLQVSDGDSIIVKGRHLITNLPSQIVMQGVDYRNAIGGMQNGIMRMLAGNMKFVIPKQFQEKLKQEGFLLEGDFADMKNLDQSLTEALSVPVKRGTNSGY